MSDERTRKLEALLAQGGLGGPRHDRIFDAVAGAKRKRAPWLSLWVAGAFASAAAGLALVATLEPAGFRVRGAEGVVLEVACAGARMAACPVGSTLMFRVSGVAEAAFVVAYAEPIAGGERIWYFVDGGAQAVAPQAAGAAAITLGQGARIGPEHSAAGYRVHVLLARRPLGRQEALRPPADALIAAVDLPLGVAR